MNSSQIPRVRSALRYPRLSVLSGAWMFAILVSAFPAIVPSARADSGPNPVVFQAQTFVRAKNGPTNYSAAFNVPGWIVAPFNMQIVNGDPSGHERVSSASISLNVVQVVNSSALSQSVGTLNVAVSPTVGQNTLQVTVDGTPGSEITITITGTNADQLHKYGNTAHPDYVFEGAGF
jgi:hypothetical protein